MSEAAVFTDSRLLNLPCLECFSMFSSRWWPVAVNRDSGLWIFWGNYSLILSCTESQGLCTLLLRTFEDPLEGLACWFLEV